MNSAHRNRSPKRIRVSAIVSAYNSERFMEGCLEDLTRQTLFMQGEMEIVVVDSGSQQNEAEAVRRAQRNHPDRIRYLRTERETLYAAWNRGVEAASGVYLTNTNTDDRHRPDALEILAMTLDRHPDVDLVYGDCHASSVPNETFGANPRTKRFRYPDFFAPAVLLHYQLGPQPMWRKSLHDRVGLFDGSFKAAGDYDFNIRCALNGRALHVPESLGLYLEHTGAISFRDDAMTRENRRIAETYRTPAVIEQLYRQEGIAVSTPLERARVLVDMGNRAWGYFPPWCVGKEEQDPEFALSCFLGATEAVDAWPPACNNLAVTLFRLGKSAESIRILELISGSADDPVIQANLRLMRAGTAGSDGLRLLDSGLEFPSQLQLAKVSPTTPVPTKAKDAGSTAVPAPVPAAVAPRIILLVTHGYPPAQLGGTQLYVRSLARQLHELGHTVRVVTPRHGTDLPEGQVREFSDDGVLVAELGIPAETRHLNAGALRKRFRNDTLAQCFRDYVEKTRPDLIHFHHLIGFSGAALESVRDMDIPTVMTLHDGWFFCEQYHFILPDGTSCENRPLSADRCARCVSARHPGAADARGLTPALEERSRYLASLLPLVDTLLTPSRHLLDTLAGCGFSHPNVLVSPLGLEPVTVPPRQTSLDGGVRFAYLGHVIPVKGLDILLRAVDLLPRDGMRLDVYGHVLDREYLKRALEGLQARDAVTLHGKYGSDELPEILSRIDVAVIPSRTESFCFTVRECLQAGIPVIASDAGALPEAVRDGENGLLFEAGNSADLAAKMRLVIENPGTLEALHAGIGPVKSIRQEALELASLYADTAARRSGVRRVAHSSSVDDAVGAVPRLIAFHLPQYHPIPENDAWWGKGFTEWSNVAKAVPQFEGHYQPHLPADLGFYDLRLPEAREAQADLAREYGINGFCYYHYWFNGRLLLEAPLHGILDSGRPDFPFCLCWANEDWTRSWDGKSGEILMGQDYNHRDDLEHIRYLLPFFRDTRYIRVNGKPLFLVYRASRLPSPLETTRIWREEARSAGIGEIYLCRVESFKSEQSDPTGLGFDAAVEFQPDWSRLGKPIDDPCFQDHKVYNYGDVVANMMQKPQAPYKRFPGVTPSWDNSARRKSGATVLNGSTPELYGAWLQHAIRRAPRENPDESIVFINAWNEWAEGNHLEPDQRFGRSYLEATSAALERVRSLDGLPSQAAVPSPSVTVVIPVHNNLDLTRQCLEALAAHTPGELFEVVIVDNASTDGTPLFLKSLGGDVTIIGNDENLGFARACNQGARAARGKYLVFLNNDTIPQPGWLTELVNFMERTPDAGAAGCKLLYPDDTIQHCGAAMRFDFAFFRHPYKSLHRNHPLVNRVRELDAVTAACLITPRETFARLGMFDEQYQNGCEDMDYCTAVRSAGLKIYYIPSSVLYHLESRTPRPKDRDRDNFRHYAAKWGTAAMMNEVEFYARDGFWQREGGRFSPSHTAVAKLEELRRSFNPACRDRGTAFAAIAKRIYPVERWDKAATPAPVAQTRIPRVLFVCHDFPPYRYAGAQLYAMNLARELNRLGLAGIDILHPVFREGYDRFEIVEAEFEGLKVFRLSKDITLGFENGIRHPAVAELFDSFLSARRYDAIHVHGLGQLSAVPVEIASRHGIPVHTTLHDYWFLCPFWHLTTPDQQLCSGPESVEKCATCFSRHSPAAASEADRSGRVAEFITGRNGYFRKTFGMMERVYAPSGFLARTFAAYGFPGVRVSPLGMIPSPVAERKPHEGLTFGFVGQIIPRKGIETLLRAFARVREENVRLQIYGRSDSDAYLQGVLSAIDGRTDISYMGGYRPEDLPEIMSHIDVAVVPSHMENYPLVIQEAFMHRVPVIASDAGGIPEVLKHDENGLMFRVQNVDDLETQLRRVIANPDLLESFRRNIGPVRTIEEDARFWAGVYGATPAREVMTATPPVRVMFYFFKNVHIPILLPIYRKLKELCPEVEIGFGHMRHAPEIRAGFTPEELALIASVGEPLYAVPQEFSPDITFIADSVYPWVEGCGRLVHVGHGVLSKGQYYTDTEIARREEAADLVCVPGSYHEQVMRTIIGKPVIATGMAKLDRLFSGILTRESAARELGLPSGRRYVLFAPTFNDELSAIPHVGDRIGRALPDGAMLLIKLHGSTKAEYKAMYSALAERDPRVFYADELDIAPFLALADVMISDVSSSMMEFAALDKPLVLFDNPDWTSYRNYNPDDIEFRWRDIGIRVKDLEAMREAVARSLRVPGEFSGARRRYADLLFANRHDGDAAGRIVRGAMGLFGKVRATIAA